MKTMQVSEFKARCLAALKEVQQTRQPLLVTLRGKPLAIVQPTEARQPGKRLGRLKGRMTIRRDLVRVDSARDWEMRREDPRLPS
jgi:prevent-host-death family protein